MLYPLSEIPPFLISTFCVQFPNLLLTENLPFYFYMFLSCVGCQGGLDRGSGHRQRSGVRLPPTSHRCSSAIAGESLSPITGCQRARFTTHRCSSAVAGEWLSPVTGCQRARFTTHRCSPAVTSECHQTQGVKWQCSPLTSVH